MPSTIRKEDWYVNSRLGELGLNKDDLIQVIKQAVLARNSTTDNDATIASGMLSYLAGTRALREMFRPKGWEIDRTDQIESIFDKVTLNRIAFLNGDCAADPYRNPQPRSQKGAGSERAVADNQYVLFQEYEAKNTQIKPLWYLCVHIKNSKVSAELFLPESLEKGFFTGYIERIFLIKPGEWDDFEITNQDDNLGPDFEVKVLRK